MNAVRGTFVKGMIVPDVQPSWEDGARVLVNLDDAQIDEFVDEDVSPEAIAKRLALMDLVEPWMTPEEEAQWKKERAEEKVVQLSMWDKWTKDIERLFQ